MKNRFINWGIGIIFYVLACLISKSFFIVSSITLLGYLVASLGYLGLFVEILILPFQLLFLLFEVNFWLTYVIPFLLSVCVVFSLKKQSPRTWKYLRILFPNLLYWCFYSPCLNKRLHWKQWKKNIVMIISPSILGPVIGLISGVLVCFENNVNPNKYYEYVTSYDSVRVHGKDVKIENSTDLRRIVKIDVPPCRGYGMVKEEFDRYYKINLEKELSPSYVEKLKKLCERDEKGRENLAIEQIQEVESKPYWFSRINSEDDFVEEYVYCIPNMDSIENNVYVIFSTQLNYIMIK